MFVAPSWNADTRPVGTECLTGNQYLRFTPNVVSTKSKINNQQSKIIRPTDKHCVPTGRRTPHPHGFLQTWRPYRTLGLRLSIRFTPNVVSTKSTIKNQQSKIPLYNAPNCFKYFSEFSLTFCGGFIESAFLKFLTAFFSSPFIA